MVIEADERWPRHTFIKVDADALKDHWPWAPDRDAADFVRAWFAEQRPAICTRRDGELPQGFMAAGIATSPAQGKRRIALKLPRSAVVAQLAPPTLREVAARSTLHQGALTELARRTEAAGLELFVFGSFAWQHLTSLSYVTASSDLDVLWRPRNADELVISINLLKRWESEFGVRADGEAVFPNEEAVSWREWAASGETILVKSAQGAQLLGRTACLATLVAHGTSP